MITYKQLSLADIFTDCQNKFDNDKYKFLFFLMKPLTLTKLSRRPLFPISMLPPACSRRHLLYPLLKALLLQLIFYPNRIPPDYFPEIFPGTTGFPVGLMFFRMLLNSPGLNRTSFLGLTILV